MSEERARVLVVDDDTNLLAGVRRHQRTHFELETADSAREALLRVRRGQPFAVIVSDLRMPGIDGIALLRNLAALAPDTTRVMLTGNGDLDSAKRAVNEGQVFRFLTKPCTPEEFRRAVQSGIEQHRLVVAERELLDQTVRGAVNVMSEILGLVNPAAFGRAARLRRRVGALVEKLELADRWRHEVAALLSQIGCVTVPPGVVEKLASGKELSPNERGMLARHPEVGAQLIAGVPRLEAVAEIIRLHRHRFDGEGAGPDDPTGDALPLGARLLKIATELDELESSGLEPAQALEALRARPGVCDAELLEKVDPTPAEARSSSGVIALEEVQPGMIVDEDLRSSTGWLLVARGQPVTNAMMERLDNWSCSFRLPRQIRVLLPDPTGGPAPDSAEDPA